MHLQGCSLGKVFSLVMLSMPFSNATRERPKLKEIVNGNEGF
jgi:hypothetical protein